MIEYCLLLEGGWGQGLIHTVDLVLNRRTLCLLETLNNQKKGIGEDDN